MIFDQDAAISAHELTKTFRIPKRHEGRFGAIRSLFEPKHDLKTAVDGLTFSIARGELVALLGPNGAGKSTSIKMMTGILTPTSGRVRVDGRDPSRDRIVNARRVGAVFGQKTQLWWDLSAKQSMDLLRDIFDVPQARYEKQLKVFDETLEISSFWDTPVRNLSLGQRVRCDIAAAMLHDPLIVFLDEPTIGMDVVAKERTREFLRTQVADYDRTVLLTTHDMGEVNRLCKRVLLINKGRQVFDGTLDALRAQYGRGAVVTVTFAEPVRQLEIAGARLVSHDDMQAVLSCEHGVRTEEVVQALVSRFPVANIGVQETDLEELMRDVYLTGFDADLTVRSGLGGNGQGA
jgi:ABC-2 type transport system ATP-binding protein